MESYLMQFRDRRTLSDLERPSVTLKALKRLSRAYTDEFRIIQGGYVLIDFGQVAMDEADDIMPRAADWFLDINPQEGIHTVMSYGQVGSYVQISVRSKKDVSLDEPLKESFGTHSGGRVGVGGGRIPLTDIHQELESKRKNLTNDVHQWISNTYFNVFKEILGK